MINTYSFGRIEVDGREFSRDLILLPDGSIHYPWWRKSGHRLTLDDLGPVLEARVESLVIGTGAFGVMKAESGLISRLEKTGISVKVLTTNKAVEAYNSLLAKGVKVAACLHLTC